MTPCSPFDRYTAWHHLRAAAGLGVVGGVFLLSPEFARGTLGATRWHVLALLLVPALAQTLAVVWNPTDPRRGLVRRPFRTLAIPVHLLLLLPLLGLLPAGPTPFVILLAGCGAAQMLLVPVQNGVLARNYGVATRGRRFGMANAVQALAIVAVGVPAGWILDRWPGSWRWLYALAAVAAVYGYLHWSRLRRRRAPPAPPGLPVHASPWAALVKDRHFLAFEACFMAYGLGFLMLQPTLPLYLMDELKVTYAQAGVAKGALFWTVMVVAGPLLGRLADRIGVLRLNVVAFLTLALFPLALLVLDGEVGLYVGYVIYGLAMSAVFLCWSLGPILLARGRDPYPYLNAHLGLVGVRALVGMVAATLLQQHFGSRAVFGCVIALEIVAAVGMFFTARTATPRPVDGARTSA